MGINGGSGFMGPESGRGLSTNDPSQGIGIGNPANASKMLVHTWKEEITFSHFDSSFAMSSGTTNCGATPLTCRS